MLCFPHRKLEHPNIVGYRATKTLENGKTILAMETCDTSLGDLLEEREELGKGPLEPAKIRKVCIDVCRALDYLHTKALIMHGDLKSYNVLIKNSFELCKLCDFGVSVPLNGDGFIDVENHPNALYVGTDIFSAPEVFNSDPQDLSGKCDMFSFGLVVYECLTLRPPHYDRLEATNASGIDDSECDNSISLNDSEPIAKKSKKLFEENPADDDAKENHELSESVVNDLSSKETTFNDSAIDNSSLMRSNAATMGDDTVAEISFESNSTDRQPMRDVSATLNSTLNESITDCSVDKSIDGTLTESWYGTRPNVPDVYTYSDEYNVFFEAFFMCTHALPEERPTAGDLLRSLETVLPTAEPKAVEQPTEKENNDN